MRKLNLLLIALITVVLGGCGHIPNAEQTYSPVRIDASRNYGSLQTVQYNGHSYILCEIGRGGGICHDENCKCKTDSIKNKL